MTYEEIIDIVNTTRATADELSIEYENSFTDADGTESVDFKAGFEKALSILILKVNENS